MIVLRIAEVLGCMPEDLFPSRLPQSMPTNVLTTYADNNQLHAVNEKRCLNPYEETTLTEANSELHDAIDMLTPNERDCIKQVYFEGQSLTDVSKQWHLTRERVRQVERKALRKLRGTRFDLGAGPIGRKVKAAARAYAAVRTAGAHANVK